ncbi:hypothetical protein DEU56DRAFT_757890 [Suillus clintonianus]|uniref:uncharacterized protein n=1 Tax=Suillus clintonianus TaxID=1904413 RepID=UPI001B878701|nr:uncharacterized protein DEU56DRAFT_757890 [Suillus clintonianus]KAG2130213.1 hypothetical protein DEU56DRAFT_757890 [Suillus clintonianus]
MPNARLLIIMTVNLLSFRFRTSSTTYQLTFSNDVHGSPIFANMFSLPRTGIRSDEGLTDNIRCWIRQHPPAVAKEDEVVESDHGCLLEDHWQYAMIVPRACRDMQPLAVYISFTITEQTLALVQGCQAPTVQYQAVSACLRYAGKAFHFTVDNHSLNADTQECQAPIVQYQAVPTCSGYASTAYHCAIGNNSPSADFSPTVQRLGGVVHCVS